MKRNYMATINFDQKLDPVSVLPDWSLIRGIKAVTFQLERASRIHWQVFLEFEYPVGIGQIVKDLESQGKQMHISKDNTSRHPNAGRNYVTKGIAVDNHRYFWSKAHGWKNNFRPVLRPKTTTAPIRPKKDFDPEDPDSVRSRLCEIHKVCVQYLTNNVKSQSVERIKII